MNKKKWSPEEKSAIVVEMLGKQRAVTQICKDYGISDGMAYRWRDDALEAMKASFSGKRMQKNASGQAEKERLLKLIGQQAVVIDYQKKFHREA